MNRKMLARAVVRAFARHDDIMITDYNLDVENYIEFSVDCGGVVRTVPIYCVGKKPVDIVIKIMEMFGE